MSSKKKQPQRSRKQADEILEYYKTKRINARAISKFVNDASSQKEQEQKDKEWIKKIEKQTK